MNNGNVEVICGTGIGNTSLALGKGITALTEQKTVIIIQFFKGSQKKAGFTVLKKLEPELKIFNFEKSSDEENHEELLNVKNGFNFAKKVAATRECDVLILDEVLEIINQNIISIEEFEKLIEAKEEDMRLILTGKVLPEQIKPYIDSISTIDYINVDKAR